MRTNYADLRSRNESPWLIPNNGTRTDHQLRSDMRRYADGDEVDLVIVGAGGAVLTGDQWARLGVDLAATLGALCEYLPQADNRVTLADEKDRHGLPVAHFAYSQCDNDKLLTKAATDSLETILKAAGAEEVITINRYAHLVGGARMASGPSDGVVDSDHRVFGVPNLYVVDGSVLPTQGAANPALTIMALAARAADRLIARGRRGQPEQARVDS
jgi:choline dehydrogenase-like flavoprotein